MSAPTGEQTHQLWKNKRKRSLYVSRAILYTPERRYSNKCSLKVEEGYAGFIFYRKNKAPRDTEETSNKQTITIHEEEIIDEENVPADPSEVCKFFVNI